MPVSLMIQTHSPVGAKGRRVVVDEDVAGVEDVGGELVDQAVRETLHRADTTTSGRHERSGSK